MDQNQGRILSAVLGASGVAAAAFYAHGLSKIADAAQMRLWAIGCAIQLVTVPAILMLVVARSKSGKIPMSASMMSLGVAFFSGTLYLMALSFPKWLGAITPIGGILLMSGWVLVAFERS